MKVSQLIDVLKLVPQNADVVVMSDGFGDSDYELVKKVTERKLDYDAKGQAFYEIVPEADEIGKVVTTIIIGEAHKVSK